MPAFRTHFPQHHDVIGVAKGKWPQQELVDDREDRGVGADAECEREHGDGREGFVFGEYARAVANVLCERFEEPTAFDVVSCVDRAIHVSKTAHRVLACLCRRHPRSDVGRNLHLDMRAHFAIDVVDNRLTLPQRSYPVTQNIPPLHLAPSSYVACRTFAIASTSRSQLASCVSSCLRPARVSL